MPINSRYALIRHLWPWLMYILAASFIVMNMYGIPSVMMQDLSSAYHVSAAMLRILWRATITFIRPCNYRLVF